MDLAQAAQLVERFSSPDLGLNLAGIESALQGLTPTEAQSVLESYGASHETLEGAAMLKRVAGQINVTIHALGIVLCLPHLLDPDEQVVGLSLGAGNTGKLWDLETDRRIAEFKFISWRGGPEAIRQNSLFKDFFYLAEYETEKSKHLYVLGTEYPLKFLRGRRAFSSILTRNAKLERDFKTRYPDLNVVREYYEPRQDIVSIEDVSPYLGGLIPEV
jgi:hypothetical protein